MSVDDPFGVTKPASLTCAALNRIADALFAQAKVSKGQLAVQKRMLDAQEANLAVTRQLEAALQAKVEQSE